MQQELVSTSVPQESVRTGWGELFGRVRDVDSHEMIPAREWVAEFGEVMEPLVQYFMETQPEEVLNSVSGYPPVDVGPIEKDKMGDYWRAAARAPGSSNMVRRLAFMDTAGIDDTLIFGSVMSILGQQFAASGSEWLEKRNEWKKLPFDSRAMGRIMTTAHNDWCIKVSRISPRLRPVASILPNNLSDSIDEAQRVIQAGVRAICIPAGQTIEGKAPSHPDNDQLWTLLANHNVPLLFHVGGENSYLREQEAWVNAPQYASHDAGFTELPIDAFSVTTSNFAAQGYLANMVLGGVFERVPNLRFGTMEYGAQWVGPLSEYMDGWVSQFARRYSKLLSMKPSEYVARNVRVALFNFEAIDRYFERYPNMIDVYCFSSDYPHFEGGANPIQVMSDRLDHLGDDAKEKFFVKNAEGVMPT